MQANRGEHVVPEPQRAAGKLRARPVRTYHVFLASPGDVGEERSAVRAFFDRYNRNYAEPRGLRFEVIDWENYSSAGVGRPQELITQQTLERYKDSLAMVIGIMAQRFGSPSGERESGTEEEFEWAMKSQRDRQFPVVKWFFKEGKLEFDPDRLEQAVDQWKKVEQFRKRVEAEKAVFARSYKDRESFVALLDSDVTRWLVMPERPWYREVQAAEDRPTHHGEWSEGLIAGLAARLDQEFMHHMQGGDALSGSEARKRYVPSVVRSRSALAAAVSAPSADAPPSEGSLEDFIGREGARLLLTGPGGRGKTTTLRHLAAEGARRALGDPSAPVYVYLSLTTFEAGQDGFRSLLDRLGVAVGLDREELRRRWQSGPRPIVFLLDALNEVSRADVESCERALLSLLQGSWAQHRYIITARPGTELESVAAKTPDLRLSFLELLEFGPEQVRAYLQAQGCADLEARISDRLEGLASNPFLLWAITRVFIAQTVTPTPASRGALFRALIDQYIFEQRERAKPKPRPTAYNYALVKKPVLAELAAKMIEDGATLVAEGKDLWTRLADRLKKLAAQNDRIHALESDTFMPSTFGATALVRELLDNGILIREGSTLRFMHESVQEYFAAVALCEAPVQAVAERAPAMNLARPNARGPMFETFVTWAGLVPQDRVLELGQRLVASQPLLCVHMFREAGVPNGSLDALKRELLKLTESEHEGRLRVGFMGLALMDLDDPIVVDRLVEGLVKRTSDAGEVLKSKSSDYAVRALVRACVASRGGGGRAAFVLQQCSTNAPRQVAAALVESWRSPGTDRSIVTALTFHLGHAVFWKARKLDEELLWLAVDADVIGDLDQSRACDALRAQSRASDSDAIESNAWGYSFGSLRRAVDEATERLTLASRRREELARTCEVANDESLAGLADTTDIKSWRIVRDQLEQRGVQLDSAYRTVVENCLRTANMAWLIELAQLPRQQARALLTDGLQALPGAGLERARTLIELLQDCPPLATIDRVFRTSAPDVRILAAHAAARMGGEGLNRLMKMLEQETSAEVIEAALRALRESRCEGVTTQLIRLLLDIRVRSDWPKQYDYWIEDPETDSRLLADSWGARIQQQLLARGDIGRTLQSVSDNLGAADIELRGAAIDAAGRWSSEASSIAVLRRAMLDANAQLRERACCFLALAGDAEAWCRLVEGDVQGPPHAFSFARSVAHRFATEDLSPCERRALGDASRTTLRPLLRDASVDVRARAMTLTRLLPSAWIDEDWHADALAVAEALLVSGDESTTRAAVRAIAVRAPDARSRLTQLLLESDLPYVQDEAREQLGEQAAPALRTELERAIASGDHQRSMRVARRFTAGDFPECAAPVLASLSTDDLDACVAAWSAASQLWSVGGLGSAEREQRKADANATAAEADLPARIRSRLRETFAKPAMPRIWSAYCNVLRSCPWEHEQSCFLIEAVFRAIENSPERLRQLLEDVIDIWPDDLQMRGLAVHVDLHLGDSRSAAQRIEALRTRFRAEQLNPAWLAERYSEINQPTAALQELRRAVKDEPADATLHLQLGWFAFLARELDESIEASRRSLALRTTAPMAAFNLGLALLARGDVEQAEHAYRTGVALARRQRSAGALGDLDGALGDFPLLEGYAAATPHVGRVRAWLQAARERAQAEEQTPSLLS